MKLCHWLTRNWTHLDSSRWSLNSHRRPLSVMAKTVSIRWPLPQHTPQKKLFLCSPRMPLRPCKGTVSVLIYSTSTHPTKLSHCMTLIENDPLAENCNCESISIEIDRQKKLSKIVELQSLNNSENSIYFVRILGRHQKLNEHNFWTYFWLASIQIPEFDMTVANSHEHAAVFREGYVTHLNTWKNWRLNNMNNQYLKNFHFILQSSIKWATLKTSMHFFLELRKNI